MKARKLIQFLQVRKSMILRQRKVACKEISLTGNDRASVEVIQCKAKLGEIEETIAFVENEKAMARTKRERSA